MGVALQKKLLALDSNVLYDLADERDFAHTFREVFQERGYRLVVPPTVVQELAYHAAGNGASPDQALKALRRMREWQILPFDLIPVGHAITEQYARLLIHRGHLPEHEMNDGLILAEVSLGKIGMLVTSDRHLLDIPSEALRLSFIEQDLEPVAPANPRGLLRALK